MTTPGAWPDPGAPHPLTDSLTAHADAIAFRLLGDANLASAIAQEAAAEVTADLAAARGFPFAFLAANTVTTSLSRASLIDPSLDDPYRVQRRDLRARFELTPVASRTVVALGCLCGHDDATVAELCSRPVDTVSAMLARARPEVPTKLLGDRAAVTTTPPDTPRPLVPPPPPAPPSGPPPATPTESRTAPPAAAPVDTAPRRRRRIRISTVVSVVLVVASVWAVTHDGGERPTFADVPAPTAVGAGGCEITPNVPLGVPQAETTVVAGSTRQYIVRLPRQLDPSKRIPLLIDLGDFGQSAEERLQSSGWAATSDGEGIVVVTLQADGAIPQWNVTSAADRPDDVAFTREVIGRLDGRLCLDKSRIWVTGMGNGALMAGALQCALSATITATVMVAGIGTAPECDPTLPISVAMTVFDGDDVLPADGGYGPGLGGVLGTPDAMLSGAMAEPLGADGGLARWAAAAGCANAPTPSKGGDVRQLAYTGCRGGTTVVLSRLSGPRRWDPTIAAAALAFLSEEPAR